MDKLGDVVVRRPAGRRCAFTWWRCGGSGHRHVDRHLYPRSRARGAKPAGDLPDPTSRNIRRDAQLRAGGAKLERSPTAKRWAAGGSVCVGGSRSKIPRPPGSGSDCTRVEGSPLVGARRSLDLSDTPRKYVHFQTATPGRLLAHVRLIEPSRAVSSSCRRPRGYVGVGQWRSTPPRQRQRYRNRVTNRKIRSLLRRDSTWSRGRSLSTSAGRRFWAARPRRKAGTSTCHSTVGRRHVGARRSLLL